MAGPRVMFGVYPQGERSEIPSSGQSMNDFVEGILGMQNMFNPSTRGGRPGAGARTFCGSRPCGPSRGHWNSGPCGGFWSGFMDPQSCFMGNPFNPSCNKEDKKQGKSKEESGKQKCPHENRGKSETTGKENGGKNQRTPEPEGFMGDYFKDFHKHLCQFMKAVNSQWSTAVTLRGFSPENIKVKVDDEAKVARIHAVHESGKDENFDRREANRIVKLPEDIIPDSVKVSYRPGGVLVIMGRRYLKSEDEMEGEELAQEKRQNEEAHEDEAVSETDVEVELENAATENDLQSTSTNTKEGESDLRGESGHLKDFIISTESYDEGKPVDITKYIVSTESREGKEKPHDITKYIVSTENGEGKAEETMETEEKSEETMEDDPNQHSDESDITKAFVLVDKDGEKETETEPFNVELNVSKFTPDQVSVKVSGDTITVTAEDKEEQDGYYSVRKLQRKFQIPSGVDPEDLKSTINNEGVLKITAPRMSLEEKQQRNLAVEME